MTVGVPPVKPAHERLCQGAEEALRAAVQAVRRDQSLREIGRTVEGNAQQYGYRVVRALHAHGIGRRMHETPRFVPHYDDATARQALVEGLVAQQSAEEFNGDIDRSIASIFAASMT